MGYHCYSRWVHSIGHDLAKEFAISMGVTLAQVQLWDFKMRNGF